MRNVNSVTLVGNLTRDPEVRFVTANGRDVAVVKFRVAVSDEYTTANGNSNKISTYIDCEAWDSAAELIGETFSKGDPIFVMGSLRSDSWEKDGVKHNTLKVRVSTFSPISRKSRSSPTPVAVGATASVANEDIPF